MEEIWRDIEGYEGLYQVSNLGRVKSLNYLHTGRERVLKAGKDTSGYLFVVLCKNGKRKTCKIHRLVASAFIENPNGLPQVNHKDEVKTNNCVKNLEWCTSEYNTNYGTRNERAAKAHSKPVYQYTLSGELVKKWDSTQSAGRDQKYSQGNISECCNGKRKTHRCFVWRYEPITRPVTR